MGFLMYPLVAATVNPGDNLRRFICLLPAPKLQTYARLLGQDVGRNCYYRLTCYQKLLGNSFSSVSSKFHHMPALENKVYLLTMFSPNTLNAQNHHLLFTHHSLISFISPFVFILRQKLVMHACVQRVLFHNDNQETIEMKTHMYIIHCKPMQVSCL